MIRAYILVPVPGMHTSTWYLVCTKRYLVRLAHLCEEDVSHGSAAHGCPRVSGHGLLHDVSCQHTDRVHSLDIWNT